MLFITAIIGSKPIEIFYYFFIFNIFINIKQIITLKGINIPIIFFQNKFFKKGTIEELN